MASGGSPSRTGRGRGSGRSCARALAHEPAHGEGGGSGQAPAPAGAPPARLADVAATSRRVAAARGRLEKIDEIAACLKRIAPDSREIAVVYLSGELPQGSIGVGPAALRAALAEPAAASPSFTLAEVELALERTARAKGPGSAAERARTLRELFARATPDEQELLTGLLGGELRQGAQQGLVVEGVA